MISASFRRSPKSPYHEEIGPTTMSRAAAWCFLFTIRVASVFNRVVYSVLEWMCGFVDTILQVYLSSSDSDIRFQVSRRRGKHDLTRREAETDSEDIYLLSPLQKIQAEIRLIRKQNKAKNENLVHKKSNNSTENHLFSKEIKLNKFEKIIFSYEFTGDRNDSSSSLDSTKDESDNANKYNVDKTKETESITDASKQNLTENELNVLKSENYLDRDKAKIIRLEDEKNSASYLKNNSTEFADEMPSNVFIKVPNGEKCKIDMKPCVSEESNETHPGRICVAPEIIRCMNPLKVSGEYVRNCSSLENSGIDKQNVSQNKDSQVISVSSQNIKQLLNGKKENSHVTHTTTDASKMSFKSDLSGEIGFSTQYPKTEQKENDQTKMHQNQKDTKLSPGRISPKQYSADADKDSIIPVSVDEETMDECSIPKPSMPETTELVLNKNIVVETRGKEDAETLDIEGKDTETISQKPNFKQVNETSTILDEVRSSEQILTKQPSSDSLKDSSSGINVLQEINVRKTSEVAVDIKGRKIKNINSPSKDMQLKDIAVTVPRSGTATCVDNQNKTSESAHGTAFNEKLGNEMGTKNKIDEPNKSLTSFESIETSKYIKIMEDAAEGSNEVRSNFATIVKMEEESALKRRKCEEQFQSDGDADGTDSAVMRYINDYFKDSDKPCTRCNTQHDNSSDESNSATPPKKSEATNKEEVEKSKKISPIEMNVSLSVPGDIQMEKNDTKTSQKPELSESNETMNTSSEVKQSLKQTLTASSAKDSSSETLKPLQSISDEMLEKGHDAAAANENRKINNDKDISEEIIQNTDIKESTVASSNTVVTPAKDQDKLSESGHNSAFNVKSKVENETGCKDKTKQLIDNSLNSHDRHDYDDYIKLVEDKSDQYSEEVKNNQKTIKNMEAECARKLKKYREQYYSNYEDKETDEAVIGYVNIRIKEKIRHPYEPTCTEPHGELTELKSNKSQKEVPNKGSGKKNKRKQKGSAN